MTPPPYDTDAAITALQKAQSENDVTLAIAQLLGSIHPQVGCRTEVPAGKGRMDLVVGGSIIEVKKRGNLNEEKDNKQLGWYLEELTRQPRLDLGDDGKRAWRGILSDGIDWYFYNYKSGKPLPKYRLVLNLHKDKDRLVHELRQTIDPQRLAAPPADDETWFETLLAPFAALAKQIKAEPYFDIKRRLWQDVLAGAHIIPPDDSRAALDLFVRHTLLVTTARLIAATIAPSQKNLTEGFVAWIEEAEGSTIIDDLAHEISRYNWKVGRDVLKDFYHTAIPTEIRHDFGEYYTPDWLATAVVEEVCDSEWAERVLTESTQQSHISAQVLDPACGSGTFIYSAIKHLEAHIPNISDPEGYFKTDQTKAKLLNRLVAGLDLHPVAVELARTTKLLALGADPGEPLNIWMGDSLQWSQKLQRNLNNPNAIEVHTSDSKNILLPEEFVFSNDYEADLKLLIKIATRLDSDEDRNTAETLAQDSADQQLILDTIATLRDYFQEGRNGVWEWYLENVAQPFRLSGNKPTRLVGNPPWVVYRHMSPERQAEFKEHAQNHGVWAGGKLAPHNDLAALFAATSVKLYLDEGNEFGFVLPYAALEARHWEPFRTGDWNAKVAKKTLLANLHNAWNLSDIKEPPFESAASCVIFGRKLKKTKALKGHLNASAGGVSTRASWDEVKPKLDFTPNQIWPTQSGHYSKDKFRQGATLVPQPLVVTDEISSLPGGIVNFRTRDGKFGSGKGREGDVEKKYVHEAIFSQHLVPFGITGCRYLIAPIKEKKFINPKSEANSNKMSRYWASASSAWGSGRQQGSPETLEARLNYGSALMSQLETRDSVESEIAVVYNTSGTYLYSAATTTKKIIDSTLYLSFTVADEAHFLCAILNAPSLSRFFTEACRRSDRHFHLGPIENLPIPKFDSSNADHKALSDLSLKAHKRVEEPELASQLTGGRVKNPRTVLADSEIQKIRAEIDTHIAKIFPPEYLSQPES